MPLCQSGWAGEGVRKGVRDEGGEGEGGGAHRGLGGGAEAEVPRERDSQDQLETDGRYRRAFVIQFTFPSSTIVAGETIKKKYNSILDMLKRERLTFSNQLESLESQIRKQGPYLT